jgi:hypothetical protein
MMSELAVLKAFEHEERLSLYVQPLELRFEVLEAVSVQIEVCQDVAPCNSLYR